MFSEAAEIMGRLTDFFGTHMVGDADGNLVMLEGTEAGMFVTRAAPGECLWHSNIWRNKEALAALAKYGHVLDEARTPNRAVRGRYYQSVADSIWDTTPWSCCSQSCAATRTTPIPCAMTSR